MISVDFLFHIIFISFVVKFIIYISISLFRAYNIFSTYYIYMFSHDTQLFLLSVIYMNGTKLNYL